MKNFDLTIKNLENKNLYWRRRYQEVCRLRNLLDSSEINEVDRVNYVDILDSQLGLLNQQSFYVIEKKTKSSFDLPVSLFYSNEYIIDMNNFIPSNRKLLEKFLLTENEADYIIQKLNSYNKGNTYLLIKQKVKLP